MAAALCASALSLSAFAWSDRSGDEYAPTYIDPSFTDKGGGLATQDPSYWDNIIRLTAGKRKDISGILYTRPGTPVTYTSSDEAVATVSAEGVVTAHKAGSAIISIKHTAAGGQEAIRKFTVKVSAADAASQNSRSVSIYAGSSGDLSKYVSAPQGAGVTWYSQKPDIVTVSGGVVTGRKAGNGTVTATYTDKAGESVTEYFAVTVRERAVDTQTTSGPISLAAGESKSLEGYVEVKPGTKVTWSTVDGSVATVFGGTVKGKKSGATVIIAKYTDINGKSQTKKITVLVGR